MVWVWIYKVSLLLRGMFFTLAIFVTIEALWPRSAPSVRQKIKGIGLTSIYLLAGAAMQMVAPYGYGLLPQVVPRVFTDAHPLIALTAFLVGYDFFFYVMHRLQHRFLWRFHGVHHSIEDLGAANSYNHISEALFTTAMIIAPLLFLGIRAGSWGFMILGIQGAYLHTATKLNFGPLRWLFNDNRFHRIHHSREREHWDKNFGLLFPFWDIVFRTAHMSDPNAWPDTGVHDIPEPRGVWDYLVQPFRRRSKVAARAE